MKLLIVEDDLSTLAALEACLRPHYAVEAASTLAKARRLLAETSFSLILLDLNLPDGSGLTLCQELRAARTTLPILILTGESGLEQKVALLDAGADDYLTKPFHGEELLARLRALLRRPSAAPSLALRVDDLELNPFTHQVTRGGRDIPLGRKPFEILEYLMRHEGQAVSRGRLLAELWDGSSDIFSNTVDVHIKHLRDRIDRPFSYPLIRTASGIGYVLKGGGAHEVPD